MQTPLTAVWFAPGVSASFSTASDANVTALLSTWTAPNVTPSYQFVVSGVDLIDLGAAPVQRLITTPIPIYRTLIRNVTVDPSLLLEVER